RHTHLGGFVRKLHHAAERPLLSNPHHIIFAFFELLRLPSHDVGIEINCLLWVFRQLLVPNEPAVIRSHIRHNSSSLTQLVKGNSNLPSNLKQKERKILFSVAGL